MILKIDRINDFFVVRAHLNRSGFRFQSIDGYKSFKYSFIDPLINKNCGIWIDLNNKIYDIGTYTDKEAETIADFKYYKEKFIFSPKGVIKINPCTGSVLESYSNVTQAERANKICGIGAVIDKFCKHGPRRTLGGFAWKTAG